MICIQHKKIDFCGFFSSVSLTENTQYRARLKMTEVYLPNCVNDYNNIVNFVSKCIEVIIYYRDNPNTVYSCSNRQVSFSNGNKLSYIYDCSDDNIVTTQLLVDGHTIWNNNYNVDEYDFDKFYTAIIRDLDIAICRSLIMRNIYYAYKLFVKANNK